MYFAQVTLFSALCVISEQLTFDKYNQGITDITVFTIPGATTQVLFSSNSISFVPDNYFINLPTLDKIFLNKNVITDIADSAFSGVPSVTMIYLNNNQLTVIREMMFSGLPNLAKLSLSFNQIDTIEPGSFSQVPMVTHIDLGSNKLTVIREMMFSGLPNLARLRLNSNQIHTIQPGSFKDNMALTQLSFGDNSLETVSQGIFDPDNMNNHPTSLNYFRMNSNPLRCDQDLCWLKQLDTTWITVGDPSGTKCAGPADLDGREWDTLTEQDLCDMSG